MKKHFFYSLVLLVTLTVFTGCEDERFYTVDKNQLAGAKWVDIWEDGPDFYEQMFIFNSDGTGIELFSKNGYTYFDEFDWWWRGYYIDIEFVYENKSYVWDVQVLERDILTFIWDREEFEYFPAY